MATLTSQQITDLRDDIGDANSTFSDAEIQNIWDRVSGARDDALRHEAALGLMARQLMANATKLHDYSAAGDRNNLSQVYKHLKELYALYKPALDEAMVTKPRQVVKSKIERYPHQTRDKPSA